MSLSEELEAARKDIKTDSYPVAIRELISLYKEGELDIHPEFQRFLRWSVEQKTKLIESILLGIPLPSVFLFQRKDGVLDVVDGLQRISTILHFAGELKDEEGNIHPELEMGAAQYVPSLKGTTWSGGKELPDEIKRFFRQEKIDVKLLLRDSDDQAKYELFQRINTGGTPLSAQEVRNCILIMQNRAAYFWMEGLSQHRDFTDTVPLPDRLLLERYDLELVLRFLLIYRLDVANAASIQDLSIFLTDSMRELFDSERDRTPEERVFERTFRVLNEALGDNAFKRHDTEKQRFMGPFLISAFELVGFGVAHNIDHVEGLGADWLRDKVADVWGREELVGAYGQGVSTSRRLPKMLEFGRRWFAEA